MRHKKEHHDILFDYVLHLADNANILGHRVGEWCGHGPVLEQDMGMTNIALDLIGQARSFYQYAAKHEGKGRTEDDMAYLRDAWDYKNCLLVEQPNGNFAYTIARQFFYDSYSKPFYELLQNSKDSQLAAIAEKSLKEVTYHLKWSSEWVIRLGDGTDISHQKMQEAIDERWMFTGEMFDMGESENTLLEKGIGVDLKAVQVKWQDHVTSVLKEATLQNPPADTWMLKGGKNGKHSEHLGFILADMQFLQRAYPGLVW